MLAKGEIDLCDPHLTTQPPKTGHYPENFPRNKKIRSSQRIFYDKDIAVGLICFAYDTK